MYNGIGLLTPRGSGTSGHVQKNASFVRSKVTHRDPATQELRNAQSRVEDPVEAFAKRRGPNQEILDHERRRKIEAQIVALQVQLEDEGLGPEVISVRCDELRERLNRNASASSQASSSSRHQSRSDSSTIFDTHQLAEQKEKQNQRMAAGLNIDDSYRVGEAFNREIQERKRQERIAKREERLKEERKAAREREKENSDRKSTSKKKNRSKTDKRASRSRHRRSRSVSISSDSSSSLSSSSSSSSNSDSSSSSSDSESLSDADDSSISSSSSESDQSISDSSSSSSDSRDKRRRRRRSSSRSPQRKRHHR